MEKYLNEEYRDQDWRLNQRIVTGIEKNFRAKIIGRRIFLLILFNNNTLVITNH